MRIEDDSLIKRLQEFAGQIKGSKRMELFALVRDFYMSGIWSALNKEFPEQKKEFEEYRSYFLKKVGLGPGINIEMSSRDVYSR